VTVPIVPSTAYERWRAERLPRLDELETVHGTLGEGPGRRWLTEQIDRSYLLLLASQLQGFCRDLHTEAATFVAAQSPASTRALVESGLTRDRKLDRGKREPSKHRLGFRSPRHRRLAYGPSARPAEQASPRKLEQPNVWRNVIVHDSKPNADDATKIQGTRPTLTYGRKLRRAAVALAPHFDEVVRAEIAAIAGASPGDTVVHDGYDESNSRW